MEGADLLVDVADLLLQVLEVLLGGGEHLGLVWGQLLGLGGL